MHGHHDRDPLLPGHPVKDIEQLQLVADVQIGGRLIEEDDLRLLADGAGQEDPLALAVADGVKGPVREVLSVHGLQRLLHLFFVRIGQDAQPPGVGIAAHGRHVPAGHQVCLQAAREHDGHPLCQFLRRILRQPLFHGRPVRCALRQPDITADGPELPRDGPQDRGFAGAVGADQRQDLPLLYADLDPADDRLPAVADGQMVKL